MASSGTRRRNERLQLFGDGFLLTLGAFVVLMALALGIQWLLTQAIGSRPMWLDAFGGLATFLPPLIGALGAWLLHGHRISWAMAGGWVLGWAAMGVAAGTFFAVMSTFFRGPQETFPVGAIVIAALVAAACLALVAVVAVDAVRDLRAETPVKPRLDWLRFVCVALLVVLVVAAVLAQMSEPTGESAEAIVFGVLFGLAGALMALGADLVTSWLSRGMADTAAGIAG